MNRPSARRGATLVELLLASAILILGLVGIVGLMLRTGETTRAGVSQANGVQFANSVLQDVQSLPFASLNGVTGADAGIVYDEAGRPYSMLLDIVEGGTPEVPTRLLTVTTNWKEGSTPRTARVSTLVTARTVDGG